MCIRDRIYPEDEIIVYCQTSMRAAPVFVQLYEAGYRNIRIYDGAYLEWSSNSEDVYKRQPLSPVWPWRIFIRTTGITMTLSLIHISCLQHGGCGNAVGAYGIGLQIRKTLFQLLDHGFSHFAALAVYDYNFHGVTFFCIMFCPNDNRLSEDIF